MFDYQIWLVVWNSHIAQKPPSWRGCDSQFLRGLCHLAMDPPPILTDLGSVPYGSTFSCVGKMLVFDIAHSAHRMEMVPSGQIFCFDGMLDYGHDTYTLLDVRLDQLYPTPQVSLGSLGKTMFHDVPTWENLHAIVELCSGFGGLGQGATACGFHPQVAIDTNQRFLDLYASHTDLRCIQGDIADPAVWYETWKTHKGAMPATAGISCQPYSSLGDGRGQADSRSKSLPAALSYAHHCRCPFLLLECVEPAANNAYVQEQISTFTKVTGFHCSQIVQRLEDVWPCRRSRRWCLLTSPVLGHISLEVPPKLNEVSRLEQLISDIRPWHSDDEHMLLLNETELTWFGVRTGHESKHVINLKGIAPTSLHAYGSQLHACACGCRSGPLSDFRLREKGIFGLLVPVPDDLGNKTYRHVHPNELQCANGYDPITCLGPNVKLSLNAVGQIASPLQSCWVFSQISRHLASMQTGVSDVNPLFNLQALRTWLVHRAHQIWQPNGTLDDSKFLSLMKYWDQYAELSLEQLMDTTRWSPHLGTTYGLGDILDHLIRTKQKSQLPHPLPTEVTGLSDDCDDLRPTPCPGEVCRPTQQSAVSVVHSVQSSGHDNVSDPSLPYAVALHPSAPHDMHVEDSVETPCLTAQQEFRSFMSVEVSDLPDMLMNSHCSFQWVGFDVQPLVVAVGSRTTLADFLRAESKLHQSGLPHTISDRDAKVLALDTPLIPGGLYFMWTAEALDSCRGVTGSHLQSLAKLTAVAHAEVGEGESRLLPIMPGRPDVLGLSGECGLLPRMPGDKHDDVLMVDNTVLDHPMEPHEDPRPDHLDMLISVYEEVEPTYTWTHPCVPHAEGNASAAGPLLQLGPAQLTALRPPFFSNSTQFAAVRTQQIHAQERTTILANQKHACADDEIRFHLSKVILEHTTRARANDLKPAILIDPLLMSAWVRGCTATCPEWVAHHQQLLTTGTVCVSAVALDGHWIPVHVNVHQNQLICFAWNCTRSQQSMIQAFGKTLMTYFGLHDFQVSFPTMFAEAETHCGAIAVMVIRHVLLQEAMPSTLQGLEYVHESLRSAFAAVVHEVQLCPTNPGSGVLALKM